jgi:hypothetical protein
MCLYGCLAVKIASQSLREDAHTFADSVWFFAREGEHVG